MYLLRFLFLHYPLKYLQVYLFIPLLFLIIYILIIGFNENNINIYIINIVFGILI